MTCLFIFTVKTVFVLSQKEVFVPYSFCQSFSGGGPYVLHALPSQIWL